MTAVCPVGALADSLRLMKNRRKIGNPDDTGPQTLYLSAGSAGAVRPYSAGP